MNSVRLCQLAAVSVSNSSEFCSALAGGMERQNLTVDEYIAAWSDQRADNNSNLDFGYLLQNTPLPIREDCERTIIT
jgi:hypothetical protein